jgi:membrane protein YdbS with pleckstrin-like domain
VRQQLPPGATIRVLVLGRNTHLGIILLVLLLALILGGLGFVLHILWWIALVVLVVWLLGFLVRMGEGTSRGRWYRW